MPNVRSKVVDLQLFQLILYLLLFFSFILNHRLIDVFLLF